MSSYVQRLENHITQLEEQLAVAERKLAKFPSIKKRDINSEYMTSPMYPFLQKLHALPGICVDWVHPHAPIFENHKIKIGFTVIPCYDNIGLWFFLRVTNPRYWQHADVWRLESSIDDISIRTRFAFMSLKPYKEAKYELENLGNHLDFLVNHPPRLFQELGITKERLQEPV
jgi:hypothetical protein